MRSGNLIDRFKIYSYSMKKVWQVYKYYFYFRYTYEMIEETAEYLKERVPFTPKIGIICGSGLGECFIIISFMDIIKFD